MPPQRPIPHHYCKVYLSQSRAMIEDFLVAPIKDSFQFQPPTSSKGSQRNSDEKTRTC